MLFCLISCLISRIVKKKNWKLSNNVLTTFVFVSIIGQQTLVFRRLLDPGPIDTLRVA